MKLSTMSAICISAVIGFVFGVMLSGGIGHSQSPGFPDPFPSPWGPPAAPPHGTYRTYPNNPYSGFSRPEDPVQPYGIEKLSPC